MELSLVIPVWNDQEGLDRLLQQVAQSGLFSDIVVVDDASEPPVGLASCPAALADRITLLRCDQQRGAGHARNLGLQHARGSHLIFFDSDDLLGVDFPRIVALAKTTLDRGETFDFLIFRHDDSRITGFGGSGTFAGEERHWQAVGASEALAPLLRSKATVLCSLSAYPWNKIYSTAFLRDNDIRCTETMVHNDLELHWTSFIAARTILHSVLIGAEHFVAEGGNRLTNRRSAERLEVFRTFTNVMARITAKGDLDSLQFLLPFLRSAHALLGWIQANVDESFHPALQDRARAFFLAHLSRDQMVHIAYHDPALAKRIIGTILKGQLS